MEPVTTYTEITKARLKLRGTSVVSKLHQQQPFVQKLIEEPLKEKPKPILIDNITPIVKGRKGSLLKSSPANRVVEEKARRHEAELKEAQEAEKKRKAHSLQLKAKLKILEKEKEEKEKQRVDQTPQKTPNNKKLAEWKRQHEEQQKIVKAYQEKKQQEKKAAEAAIQEMKKKEQEMKKKEFKEFNLKRIAEIKKLAEEAKENKSIPGNTKETNEFKPDKEYRSKRLEELKKEVEELGKQKREDEEIHTLLQKKEIRDIFKQHERSLKQLYNWYCLSAHHSIGSLQMNSLLFKPFMAFANDFMINPTIIPIRQVEFVFKSLTKSQNPPDGKQVSLSFEEFEEALVRIAIKGREILNQIYNGKTSENANTISQALGKMAEIDNGEVRKDAKAAQADTYEKIDQMTKNTILGLFYFLDLPSEKQALCNKLQELKNCKLSMREKKLQWKKLLETASGTEQMKQAGQKQVIQAEINKTYKEETVDEQKQLYQIEGEERSDLPEKNEDIN